MKMLQKYYKRITKKFNNCKAALMIATAAIIAAFMITALPVTAYADDTIAQEDAVDTAVASTQDSGVDTTTVYTGYISAKSGVKVYEEASTSSSKAGKLAFNKKIKYTQTTVDGWVYVCSGKVKGYIKSEDISSGKIKASTVTLTGKVTTFKSYMSRSKVGDKNSAQYKLQKLAKVGKYGITTVNGRYCIAVGSGVGADIGQYVDLVLENGTVIECIVGDHKGATFRSSNGCVSEFIVSVSKLASAAKSSGSISSCQSDWNSPVKTFIVYDEKVDL